MVVTHDDLFSAGSFSGMLEAWAGPLGRLPTWKLAVTGIGVEWIVKNHGRGSGRRM